MYEFFSYGPNCILGGHSDFDLQSEWMFVWNFKKRPQHISEILPFSNVGWMDGPLATALTSMNS